MKQDAHEDPMKMRYRLRLFVAGASLHSVRAIETINRLCSENLSDRFVLEIIDVHQQPELAEKEQIVALPMLIKDAPDPSRRLIGDMSDIQKVLRVLGIPSNELH